MVQDFVLIHRKGGGLDGLEEPWFLWKTCLRQIAFGLREFDIGTDIEAEIYRGEAAYAFALEVVCGLKSPLVGETEVMGQYRELITKFRGPPQLKKIFENLLTDAKAIRHGHLSKLGSQSYGSLSRKLLAQFERLHVLGTGQLTEELLPWFSDKKSVIVHGRRIDKKAKLERDFSYVELRELSGETQEHLAGQIALVVAAPMKSERIREWIGSRGYTKILDLRGESRTDPITGFDGIVALKDFYQNLEADLAHIRDKVDAARGEIVRLSAEKARMAELRPFGWDDICA